MGYKKYLKFVIIYIILFFIGFFAVYGYNKITGNLSKTSQSEAYYQPRLMTEAEKIKYKVETDQPAYIEMVPGTEDLPGPLPRIILPKQLK